MPFRVPPGPTQTHGEPAVVDVAAAHRAGLHSVLTKLQAEGYFASVLRSELDPAVILTDAPDRGR